MKRACVFMANGTEECEALLTVDILRRAGVEVVTASVNQKPEILSSHNVRMDTDAVAADIQAADFDLVMLPGGMPGTLNLKENEFVKTVCQQAAAAGKLVAAICAAPSALAAFGLLEGKKATAYPSFTDQLAGATVVKEPVVEDGDIITGWGLGASIPFSLALVRRLCGANAAEAVRQAIGYLYSF